MFNLEAFVWYLFLADSLLYNLLAYTKYQKWYKKQFGLAARHFPITKGVGALYIFLVIWLGFTLNRLGTLPW